MSQSTIEGSLGRNSIKQEPGAETEADAMRKGSLLAQPLSLLSYLSYTIQDHLIKDTPTHSGLEPPLAVRKTPTTDIPNAQCDEGNPSVEVPLPKCVKLTPMLSVSLLIRHS